MKSIAIHCLSLFLLVSGLSSCISNARFNYLLDTEKARKQNFVAPKADTSHVLLQIPSFIEFRINTGDWLMINIKSDKYSLNLDKDFSINPSRQMGGNQMMGGGAYFLSYMVDSLGNVNLPIIGSIKVKGLTTNAAELVIEQEVRKYYKTSDIFVQVKNAQLYYSIIGEVTVQGFYQMQANNLSVIEAIAQAGGLNPVANRGNIRLIRMYNGTPKMYSINLNDISSVTRTEFFIQPKDIIIVDALPIRQTGLINPSLKEGASLFLYLTSLLTVFKIF